MSGLTYKALQTDTYIAGTGHAKNIFLEEAEGKVVTPCSAGGISVGVSLIDGTSGRSVAVISKGTVPVIVGSGGVTLGAKVVSDANGKAVLASALAVSAGGTTVTGDAASPTFTGSTTDENVLGIAKSAGSEGDIVNIQLY